MNTYTGGCHCGAVRFEVISTLEKVIECNCSHCEKKGLLLTFVPKTQFTLLQGEVELTEYRFNKKKIAHLFCKVCGVQPFGHAQNPEGMEMSAINVRCLDGIDIHSISPTPVDGKSW